MVFTCTICCEESMYMTAGVCEHKVCCLRCTVKLRSINFSTKCVYCNQELKEVVVLDDEEKTFAGERAGMQEFDHGIHFINESTQGACVFLSKFRCKEPFCECKEYFKTTNNYKLHLSRDHHKFLCGICEQNEVLLLNEHPTYTAEELSSHLQNGTFDEEYNLVALHPFCSFCNAHFFNDDAFKDHLKKDHEKCYLCEDEKNRWHYYKNYSSLEKHFEKSHFICKEQSCKQITFVAFKTERELQLHNKNQHGVYFDSQMDSHPIRSKREVRNDEGENFSGQLLQERKKRSSEFNEQEEVAQYKGSFDQLLLLTHVEGMTTQVQEIQYI